MNTRYFNGTRDGAPYQARVTRRDGHNLITGHTVFYEVDIVIFDKTTGEPHYAFTRIVPTDGRGQKATVRDVLKDPEAYV